MLKFRFDRRIIYAYIALARIFQRGVTLCQSEGTHQIVMSTSTPCFWFKKISSKKVLFNYGQDIVMAFSPPVVGCLVKQGLQKGGSRAPRTPLATPLAYISTCRRCTFCIENFERSVGGRQRDLTPKDTLSNKNEKKKDWFPISSWGNVTKSFTGLWCCPLAAWWDMYWKESWSYRKSHASFNQFKNSLIIYEPNNLSKHR